jgi:ABC-2 type transport system ATP-binding protein
MTPVIELRSLRKVFKKDKGTTVAVDNVSLSIPKGIIFGLLGPNGAGKSTTIAMICTLLRPTSGTVLVNGSDVNTQLAAARANIGLVFQEPTLDVELSAYENLIFQAMIYKVPKKEARIAEVLKFVGLEKVKNDRVKTYSGGMKRRLEIARALINEPNIILLDEPTLGLDASSRKELWQYLQKLIKEKQLTVLLTTHYLEEAERLCEQVAIMDQGKIVAQGATHDLIAKVAKDSVHITLTEENKALVAKIRKTIPKAKASGKEIRFFMDDASADIAKILKLIPASSIAKLEIKKPTLEDAYLHYAGKRFDESDQVKKK